MQGTYVNLAAAIDGLADAERAATEADDAYRTEHNPHMLPLRRTLSHRRAAFAASGAHARPSCSCLSSARWARAGRG